MEGPDKHQADVLRAQLGQELLKRFNNTPTGGGTRTVNIEEKLAANKLAPPTSTTQPSLSPDVLKKPRGGSLVGTPVSLRPTPTAIAVGSTLDPINDNTHNTHSTNNIPGKTPPPGVLQSTKKSHSATDLHEVKQTIEKPQGGSATLSSNTLPIVVQPPSTHQGHSLSLLPSSLHQLCWFAWLRP